MFNLMKYEWLKQKSTKYLLGGFLLFAELVFLFGVFAQREEGTTLGIMFLSFLSIIGLVVVALEAINTYYHDMTEKRGYMLFMTPYSTHAILAGKLLAGFIAVVLWTVLVLILAFIDVGLLVSQVAGVRELFNMFRAIIEDLYVIEINWGSVIIGAVYTIAEWASIVTTAFFAITISVTLLSTVRWKGFISFLIFVAISFVNNYLNNLLTTLLGLGGRFHFSDLIYVDEVVEVTEGTVGMTATLDMSAITIVACVVNLIFCLLCYFGAGALLKKKLSL